MKILENDSSILLNSKSKQFIFVKENEIGENPIYYQKLIYAKKNPDKIINLEEISVNCYNILADKFFSRLIYGVPKSYSSFQYRSENILSELEFYKTDIICLQEVDNYEAFYREKLEKLGYATIFKEKARKGRYYWLDGVGCVLGYNKEKYDLIDYVGLIYDDFDENLKNMGIEGVFGLFQIKKTNKVFLVASTHTHFISDYNCIQYGQIACLMTNIKDFLEKKKLLDIPLIVCGDFNSNRFSNVVDYMQQIPPKFLDYKRPFYRFCKHPIEKVNALWRRYPNFFKLKSAYEYYEFYKQDNVIFNEEKNKNHEYYPEYTVYNRFIKGVIDFIFYSDKIILKAIREMPSRIVLGDHTPNKNYSSDHLRIEAIFLI